MTRRAVLSGLGITLLGSGANAEDKIDHAKQTAASGEKLRAELKSLAQGDFAKQPGFDQALVKRTKDGFRNGAPKDSTGSLCVLAAAGESDFLLLVWCSSELPEVRFMVLLLELSTRDKYLDYHYDFDGRACLFADAQARAAEIEFIKANLKDLVPLLIPLADSLDKEWAGWIRTVSGADRKE